MSVSARTDLAEHDTGAILLPPGTLSGATHPSEASDTPKSENSKLFGRGLLYVVIWSLQLVAGTIVSPILAHLLGPAEFGALASAIALHQVLSVFALLGLDQALILQRTADKDASAARSLVSVGIALSLVVSIVFAATSPLWRDALGFGGHPTLVYAVILWTAPAAAVQVMLALLLTEDRIRPFAVMSALAAVGGQVAGIVLLLAVHVDATTYAFGAVGSQFAAMLIGIIVVRPRLRGMFDREVLSRAIRLGAPLAIGGLAYFVLNAGDRVIIQSLLGTAEVGRYQVAYVVGSVVVLLLTFTSSAWSPRFAALKDINERYALAALSRDTLYRLLSPMLVGITLAAPMALSIVAPPSFRPESLAIVVFLVALSAFPVAASGATGRILITLRRGKTLGLISCTAALVNIGLNLLLVPRIGIQGSALATLISYLLLAVLQQVSMPKQPKWRGPSFRLLARVAFPIALAGLTLLLPQTLDWNIGRLIVAVACLPWFLINLKRARKGPKVTPASNPISLTSAAPNSAHARSNPVNPAATSVAHHEESAVTNPAYLAAIDAEVATDRLLPSAPSPVRIVSIDLNNPLPDLAADDRYDKALVVGWRGLVPIGTADVDLRKSAPPLQQQLEKLYVAADAAAAPLQPVPDDQLPAISVLVPTVFQRPDDIALLLDGFTKLVYPQVEFILVDNRPIIPSGDGLAQLVKSHPRITVVHEPHPGVAAARNAAFAAASHDLIVYTDDDVRVDAGWLRAIGSRFVRQPSLQALSGLILPAELETPAQIWFERYYGGFSGERTFASLTLEPHRGTNPILRYSRVNVVDSAGNRQKQFAVWGIGSFGAGANMAFRREALSKAGVFDFALGTGTPARGGEDLATLVSVLWNGGTMGFEPTAVVHHRHRLTFDGFMSQLRGNGVGFTAMMASLIAHDKRHAVAIGAQLPLAGFQIIRQAFARISSTRASSPTSAASAFPKATYPRNLMTTEVSHYPFGPSAYRMSVRRERQWIREHSGATFSVRQIPVDPELIQQMDPADLALGRIGTISATEQHQ